MDNRNLISGLVVNVYSICCRTGCRGDGVAVGGITCDHLKIFLSKTFCLDRRTKLNVGILGSGGDIHSVQDIFLDLL